ncbi:NUDIX domain-containing protein [Nonomuraea jiangxiensis]|uniref:NUDIX domain-containing protein n=1 Tax=Nonomuraea jiangxiensis TaxID=633440 RepID=A0A1G8BVT7_9ACTN|nr:NUDIX domain-containing protein [Nonomuraea jiangxiensis]SDH37244.1 NUDIX domain-containing protein [Nonomuraea jiangxiensis]
MRERVRAIPVDHEGHLLTIKRIKPEQMPYRVLPGGGVEDSDTSLEAALKSELREEAGLDDG